jgi:hypothetical protein
MTRTTPLLISASASGVPSLTTSIFRSPIFVNEIKVRSSSFSFYISRHFLPSRLIVSTASFPGLPTRSSQRLRKSQQPPLIVIGEDYRKKKK